MFIRRVKEPSVFRGIMHLLRMPRYASRVRVNQPLCSAAWGLLIPLDAHVEPNPCAYSQLLLLGLSCKATWAGPKRACLLTVRSPTAHVYRLILYMCLRKHCLETLQKWLLVDQCSLFAVLLEIL